MENTIRTFIAIPLSPTIVSEIGKIIQALRQICPNNIRWVNPQGIHLTLKFLGDIPQPFISKISECMTQTAKGTKTFQIEVRGFGAFPRPEQARVIWVGLEKSNQLTDLQNELDQNLKMIGFPLEKRAFNPHLTIARVKDRISPAEQHKIATIFEKTQIGSLGTLQITGFSLFQSELKPGGAVYSKLATVEFGQE